MTGERRERERDRRAARAHSPAAVLDMNEHVPGYTGFEGQRLLGEARPRAMFPHRRANDISSATPGLLLLLGGLGIRNGHSPTPTQRDANVCPTSCAIDRH